MLLIWTVQRPRAGWQRWRWRWGCGAGISSRNWRRRPPVTFYSLTLPDYRQLMHNKYTALRVHYRLINISLWTGRTGLPEWQMLCWDWAGLTMSQSSEGTWCVFFFLLFLFFDPLIFHRPAIVTVTWAFQLFLVLQGPSWLFQVPPYSSCLLQALQPRLVIEPVMDKSPWPNHLTWTFGSKQNK